MDRQPELASGAGMPAPVRPRVGFFGSGLSVLLFVVGLGLLPAAWLAWMKPRLRAQREAVLAASPSSVEGRLSIWHEYGAAMIHQRLTQQARFSADAPWLVIHALRTDEPGVVEAFGIDLASLPLDTAHLEGRRIVVALPEPHALGRLRLEGERARYVPVFAALPAAYDPAARLADLALWFLEGMPASLAEDIPGASLVVQVGEREPVSADPASKPMPPPDSLPASGASGR